MILFLLLLFLTTKVYVMDAHPTEWRLFMSAGYDGRIVVWDLETGEPVRRITHTMWGNPTEDSAAAAAFSPRGGAGGANNPIVVNVGDGAAGSGSGSGAPATPAAAAAGVAAWRAAAEAASPATPRLSATDSLVMGTMAGTYRP
jgi:hypothetical protein